MTHVSPSVLMPNIRIINVVINRSSVSPTLIRSSNAWKSNKRNSFSTVFGATFFFGAPITTLGLLLINLCCFFFTVEWVLVIVVEAICRLATTDLRVLLVVVFIVT